MYYNSTWLLKYSLDNYNHLSRKGGKKDDQWMRIGKK